MDCKIINKIFLILIIFAPTQLNAIEFKGKFLQGHYIIGFTDPSAKILIEKKEVKVSKDGYFVFGIDRDRKFDLTITKINNGKKEKIIKKVLKRKYNIQRIDGLEESKVTPPESVYKRIKEGNSTDASVGMLAPLVEAKPYEKELFKLMIESKKIWDNFLRDKKFTLKTGLKKIGFNQSEVEGILGNNWYNFYKNI